MEGLKLVDLSLARKDPFSNLPPAQYDAKFYCGPDSPVLSCTYPKNGDWRHYSYESGPSSTQPDFTEHMLTVHNQEGDPMIVFVDTTPTIVFP
jgi:hypothetical protein